MLNLKVALHPLKGLHLKDHPLGGLIMLKGIRNPLKKFGPLQTRRLKKYPNPVFLTDQTTILLLLKNSYSVKIIHIITWETSLVNAFKILQDNYSFVIAILKLVLLILKINILKFWKADKKGKNSSLKNKTASQKKEPFENKLKEKDFKSKKSKSKKEKNGNESFDNKKSGKSIAFIAVNYDLIINNITKFATEQISGTNYAKNNGIVNLDVLDLLDSSESDLKLGNDSKTNIINITHYKCYNHVKNNAKNRNYKGKSLVLYDTGSTNHIFNSIEFFTAFLKNCNVIIRTALILISLTGYAIIRLEVLCIIKNFLTLNVIIGAY
ncbi:hypothetical protein MAPG_08075 [Magnaporthiopsis poae ATCC 64411]|uniref:Uncharacterized protein n=1 Tax=Magnaporthiopsis poae (strain ATCC 64411 / 73-15) TaxID=644358 RepID=A0A0C4E6E1_MAGP6|nr:hypothetical protein MAPG_08075 [Magnaporthiopsis poae ATCC 64411]